MNVSTFYFLRLRFEVTRLILPKKLRFNLTLPLTSVPILSEIVGYLQIIYRRNPYLDTFCTTVYLFSEFSTGIRSPNVIFFYFDRQYFV